MAGSSAKARAGIRETLFSEGILPGHECVSGAQVLSVCKNLSDAIIICHRLTDISAQSLAYSLSANFDILLLLSSGQTPLYSLSNVLCLNLPIRRAEFTAVVKRLLQTGADSDRRSERNEADRALIGRAKLLLMKKSGLSEQQAHKAIQKRSMDSGKSLTEIAKTIISKN